MLKKIDNYLMFIIMKKSFNNKFLNFLYYKVKDDLFKNNKNVFKNRMTFFKEFKSNIENKTLKKDE